MCGSNFYESDVTLNLEVGIRNSQFFNPVGVVTPTCEILGIPLAKKLYTHQYVFVYVSTLS